MTLPKPALEIGMKRIFSGSLIMALIAALPMGLISDSFKKESLFGTADAMLFSNFWIYTALSAIGGILAWAMPNAMVAWSGIPKIRTIVPMCLISTGTIGILTDVVRGDLQGATWTALFMAIGLAGCLIAVAWKRSLK